MARQAVTDRDYREFVTSEGVDLRLRLGTIGERAAAFVVDIVIIVATLFVFTLLALFVLIGGQGQGAEALGVIWLLGFFLLRNFYFIAFELGTRGATPGKRISKLRVVARDGGRLTGGAVIARNVMRELEVIMPLTFLIIAASDGSLGGFAGLAGLVWTGTFLLFPMFNRDRLRVGDLIAGTWVVRVPRRELGANVVAPEAAPRYVFTDAQLGAYGEFELQKLEEVIRRAEELSVIVVARTIRGRIGWTGPEGDDLEFLRAYYTALCQRLERGMLFGKRRADKYS